MEDEKCDFISNLPQDILKRIVSILPLDQAVRTSAFSTIWRSLWVPDLLICHQEELEEIICMLSKSYDVHRIWKLCLIGYLDRKKAARETEDETVTVLATKGTDHKLHLEFSNKDQKESKNFHLSLNPSCLVSQATCRFSTVKTLCVRSINYLGQNLISAFFSISNFLESLELENCHGLQSLNIEANDQFHSLKLYDCPDMVDISISARNLRSFWYQGVLPHQIQLKNTLNLVEVMLDLKDGFCSNDQFDCEEVLSFLTSLAEIETLTISGWLLEWLCSGGVIFSRLEFRFNKLKELSWIDSGINKTKRGSLTCFLNICPVLEKLLIKVDSNLNSIHCPHFHQYWHEPHLWMDDATLNSNTSELKHLKIVEFWGYESEKDQILLVELLLEKANMLKSITVTSPENNHSWEIANIPQSQLKQTWHPCNYQQPKIAVYSLIKSFFLELFGEINVVFCPEKAGICSLSLWF